MDNKIIQITSGRGPVECCWVVAKVLKLIIEASTSQNLRHEIIHREPGPENGTLYSASLKLSGKNVESFLSSWIGTIQWIGQSRYRKFHKRKNWFIAVNDLQSNTGDVKVADGDIRYQFTRSGGPGGKHVNKVSTAVRAIHVPTGQTVFVSNGRSQLQNKNEARRRLIDLIESSVDQKIKEHIKDEWNNHNHVSRGSPIQGFRGTDFKPNHRSKKYKSGRKSDKQKVLRELDI